MKPSVEYYHSGTSVQAIVQCRTLTTYEQKRKYLEITNLVAWEVEWATH